MNYFGLQNFYILYENLLISSLVISSVQFSSVQLLSCVRLFATLWITARQASLSITSSRSSLKFTSIESVMPSSHLILCHPLLLLPSIPPSIRIFSNEWYHQIFLHFEAPLIQNYSPILSSSYFTWNIFACNITKLQLVHFVR